NRNIVTLRASYYGVLTADRAAQAANRIREAVARDGPGAVKMVTTPEGLNVTIDGVYVFRILDGDLDAEDGQTFDEARAVVGKRLDEAIESAHSSIRGGELAWALVLTLAAAAAFCLAVWLLARGRRWLRQRLDTYLTRRLRIWEEERTTLARVIRTFGHFVFLGIVLVIAEECLRFVFRLFPYTRPWSEKLTGYAVVIAEQVAGAAGLVGQAAGGFILTFAHVLRPGEWVRVGDVEGAVVGVGVFSTRIRTPLDEEVNVPNSVLLGSVTRNFSRPAAQAASILETSVTIGYSAPWRQVHAMLLDAAARTPELEREPPPEVLQTALSDFYVRDSLRARLRDQHRRPAVLSALNANVQDAFNEYGVQIMSPHYVLDAAAPVVVPKTQWFEPPAT